MALLNHGSRVRCDAAGCAAEARLPLGLGQRAGGEATGWLFVVSELGGEQYCPACSARYLACADACEEKKNDTRPRPGDALGVGEDR